MASPLTLATSTTEWLRKAFGEAVEREIQDAQIARNLIFLLSTFEEREITGLAERLRQTEGSLGEAVTQEIVALVHDQIKRSLDPSRRTIALYYPTAAYRENLAGLVPKLRRAGYNVIVALGAVCNDRYEAGPQVFFGGRVGRADLMSAWDFVDLVLTPVLVTDLPAAVRKVYFLHDIHDSPLGDEKTTYHISELLQEYDYIYAPSSHVADLFRQVVPLARSKHESGRRVGIIPGGYTKLDRFIAYFEKHRQEAKSIIYAPTVTGYGLDEVGSVTHHGEAIVNALLENVPDHELIFRPHPHSLTSPVVLRIIERYRSHPRFTLDTDASFYMDTYSRARLMVSDISGTAFTYAFGTLRPVVFCSFNEPEVQARYGHLRYVRDRQRVGYIAQDLAALVEHVRAIVAGEAGSMIDIRSYRDSVIYNVGHAEDYFVEHCQDILDGRIPSDWQAV